MIIDKYIINNNNMVTIAFDKHTVYLHHWGPK